MKKIYGYTDASFKTEILFKKQTKIQKIISRFSSKKYPIEYFISRSNIKEYIPKKIGEGFSHEQQGPLEISCLFKIPQIILPLNQQAYSNSNILKRNNSCPNCKSPPQIYEKPKPVEKNPQEPLTLKLTNDYMVSKEPTAPKEPTHTFYKVMRTITLSLD